MKEHKLQAFSKVKMQPIMPVAVTTVPSALFQLGAVLLEIAQNAEPTLSHHINRSSNIEQNSNISKILA
ncbi:MAG: hypothetical protein PHF74_05365 [Dehalococcoidales bacterium]|nr:hypothetical protein [Dehalococcoidales bacterium]